ncbi:hypothetical protein D3C85_1178360 [compost metagenome]
MQWPPTRPGRNGRKFHFVPAACSTSRVSMPMRSKMMASSFISAMFRSRCVFSITLAASATLMLDARCTPASTTPSYRAATWSRVASSSPETTLRMLCRVWSLSPGLMRSGEKPT